MFQPLHFPEQWFHSWRAMESLSTQFLCVCVWREEEGSFNAQCPRTMHTSQHIINADVQVTLLWGFLEIGARDKFYQVLK